MQHISVRVRYCLHWKLTKLRRLWNFWPIVIVINFLLLFSEFSEIYWSRLIVVIVELWISSYLRQLPKGKDLFNNAKENERAKAGFDMYAKLLQGTSSKVTIESLIGIEVRTTITSLLKNKKINNENCDLFEVIMTNDGKKWMIVNLQV